MVTARRMSLAEYLDLPEEKPYLEYVCGEVRPKVAPSFEHSAIAHEFSLALGLWAREHGGRVLIEPRVRFIDDERGRVHVLDLGYWAPDRPIGNHRAMSPPTLAIEIRSPEQPRAQQRERCETYRRFGVEATWLVDPEERVIEVAEGESAPRIFRTGDTLSSPLLPGFALDIDELFGALDEFADA